MRGTKYERESEIMKNRKKEKDWKEMRNRIERKWERIRGRVWERKKEKMKERPYRMSSQESSSLIDFPQRTEEDRNIKAGQLKALPPKNPKLRRFSVESELAEH